MSLLLHHRTFVQAVSFVVVLAAGIASPGGPMSPADAPSAMLAVLESPSEDELSDDAEVAPLPERVILQTGRHEQVAGVVEREDADLIVIRTPEDEVQSFLKVRLLKLTRLVHPEEGQRGVVHMQDGSMREGIVLADEFTHVLIEIEGIRTRLTRDMVDHVELLPTFEEQYEAYRAAIQPEMYDRRVELCRWLIEEKRYDLAETELRSLCQDHPGKPEAQALLRQAQAQLRLAREAMEGGEDSTTDAGDENELSSEDEAQVEALSKDLITDADVNIIRVLEIDFRNPPQVRVEPETIRALIDRYGSHPAVPATMHERTALYRKDPIEVVRLMFEVRARDLYPEIKVLSEPYALNLFRQRVHNTWLMNNCATSRCHGGVHAGRLFLRNRGHRDDRVRYTNLLTLERLKVDEEHRLIDYDDPTESLIIQYGLPRTDARHAHPDVAGWTPVFTRGNQKMLEDAVKWIESMYQPRPDYPVAYEPPVIEAAPFRPGEQTTDGVDR